MTFVSLSVFEYCYGLGFACVLKCFYLVVVLCKRVLEFLIFKNSIAVLLLSIFLTTNIEINILLQKSILSHYWYFRKKG